MSIIVEISVSDQGDFYDLSNGSSVFVGVEEFEVGTFL